MLFDQHAVHERIRLESLTKSMDKLVYNTCIICNILLVDVYEPCTGNIRSITLNSPLVLYLNQSDREQAMTFANQLQAIGNE